MLNYNNQSQEQLLRDLFGNNIWGRLFLYARRVIFGDRTGAGKKSNGGWHGNGSKQDPLVQVYLWACRRLAQRGFIRQQDETPQTFVQRLQAVNHPAAPIMQQLTTLSDGTLCKPITNRRYGKSKY